MVAGAVLGGPSAIACADDPRGAVTCIRDGLAKRFHLRTAVSIDPLPTTASDADTSVVEREIAMAIAPDAASPRTMNAAPVAPELAMGGPADLPPVEPDLGEHSPVEGLAPAGAVAATAVPGTTQQLAARVAPAASPTDGVAAEPGPAAFVGETRSTELASIDVPAGPTSPPAPAEPAIPAATDAVPTVPGEAAATATIAAAIRVEAAGQLPNLPPETDVHDVAVLPAPDYLPPDLQPDAGQMAPSAPVEMIADLGSPGISPRRAASVNAADAFAPAATVTSGSPLSPVFERVAAAQVDVASPVDDEPTGTLAQPATPLAAAVPGATPPLAAATAPAATASRPVTTLAAGTTDAARVAVPVDAVDPVRADAAAPAGTAGLAVATLLTADAGVDAVGATGAEALADTAATALSDVGAMPPVDPVVVASASPVVPERLEPQSDALLADDGGPPLPADRLVREPQTASAEEPPVRPAAPAVTPLPHRIVKSSRGSASVTTLGAPAGTLTMLPGYDEERRGAGSFVVLPSKRQASPDVQTLGD